MITNQNTTDSPSESESDPTLWGSGKGKQRMRTPWWPALIATVVGGALAFPVSERGGMLPAIGYTAVAAFLGSYFFKAAGARAVRRIAGGVVLGGALAFVGVAAFFLLALTVGGAQIG